MSQVLTKRQVSAGGVVFRRRGAGFQVALISVGPQARWQLPKGLVGPDEEPERAALREVREETGLTAEILQPLETVEYWYFASERGARVRYHKFVHFYLMRYVSGSTEEHDAEVNEARWFSLTEALKTLAFKGERAALQQAREVLSAES
jgi:8-oxo-dGTP pyrophosphatase MutT (NUDIX family)